MDNLIKERLITAEVISIRWERIFLYLDVRLHFSEETDRETELEFYAVEQEFFDAQARFQVLGVEDDVYHLKLNVTNNGENRCVPTGTYSIVVCQGDAQMAECETSVEVVGDLEASSRNFLYGKSSRAYTVTFYVEEGDEILPFRFHILASAMTGMNFPQNVLMRNLIHPIKNVQKSWLSKKNFLRRLYAFYAGIYGGKRKKTILFMSEQNGVIASNLKAVSDQMKERGMDQEYELLYSARAASENGHSIKSWLDMVHKLGKSGTVIIDDHAPVLDWLHLKEDTKLIQLWHAGAGFKSSGYSRWGHMGCPGPVSCHRQYDFGIAGSKHIAPFFSEVWGINDEQVLATGMPRMDEYLDENYKSKKTEELYEKYPMCKGKKVILFAPTYRGKNKITAYYPYELIDFEGLYELCGEEYVVLFKMHPWVASKVPIEKKYKDRFMDVGKYPNINDLFYITDLLITDYSSNIFEYSLMRKPMLFFAFDKIQYSFSRGFHRAYEESAPGKVCYHFEEVLEAIRTEDFEYEKVEEYIEKHFDYIDSHASDRVIDWLVLGNLPEDVREDLARVDARNKRMRSLNFAPEGYVPPEAGKKKEED